MTKIEKRARALRLLLPRVPVRHWTMTLPPEFRAILAQDETLATRASRAFVRELFAMYREHAGLGDEKAECGAVVVVHRFGSALDRNFHLHAVTLDGVYETAEAGLRFHARRGDPSRRELASIGTRIAAMMGSLQRGHKGATSPSVPPVAGSAPRASGSASANAPLRRLRIVGPTARRPALSMSPRGLSPGTRGASVEVDGFRVFAGDAVESTDRQRVAALARYVVHPPADLRAIEPGPPGRVRYRLARPAEDGTTHLEFSHAQLRERLADVINDRTSGRVNYHGVLAPGAVARWRVVPTQLLLPGQWPRPTRRHAAAAKPNASGPGAASTATQSIQIGVPPPCPRCGTPMKLVGMDEHSPCGDWSR